MHQKNTAHESPVLSSTSVAALAGRSPGPPLLPGNFSGVPSGTQGPATTSPPIPPMHQESRLPAARSAAAAASSVGSPNILANSQTNFLANSQKLQQRQAANAPPVPPTFS